MTTTPSWDPVSDPVLIKRLGKTSEELSELAEEASRLNALVSRILIQGLQGVNPETGVPNLENLEKEIADVYAQLDRTVEELKLNKALIQNRRNSKYIKMIGWETELKNKQKQVTDNG